MAVSAVIPHWNRRDLLATLLENLKRQTQPFDEVIVVDNGSSDDSAALAEQNGARVVRLERNLGFAAAVNRGVQASASDWVAILNNDVTLDPHWLERLLDAAGREGAFFATGKILSAADPTLIDGTFDEFSRAACACRCGAGKPDGPFWNLPCRIRIAPMTAALFRRSLFDELGPLDERLESYLEDIDFGFRCTLRGCFGVYVPEAVSWHLGSATAGRWNKDTVRRISRNQVLLAAKHLRGQPLWPIMVGQLLWGLVALRHGRGLPYLRGKVEGLKQRCGARAHQQSPERLEVLSPEKVRLILEESERHIFESQQQGGFDRYWRAYFWLLRR